MTDQLLQDAMDPARAAALHAALALPGPPPGRGDALPPFFHLLYFWDPRPPEALGRDGHPAQGVGPVPETGLPRRMWAGGRVERHAPLVLGRPAARRTRLDGMERKEGRTGALAFVTLIHEIEQEGRPVLTERQDLVYREDGAPSSTPVAAPPGGRPLAFDPVLLFRYSALTLNGHRIHYDADYARDVEGYGGLVIHGPLLATLMALEADAAVFSFRGRSPLICGEDAVLGREGDRLWVAGADGRLCMEGWAEG